MSNFRNKLKKQQDSFNRKVRRVIIVLGIAALLVAGFGAYIYFTPFQKSRDKNKTKISQSQALENPTVIPTADPNDPAQVVLPGLLMSERPANPVTITSAGKQTKIDKSLISLVLEAVKKIPQDELEARVDHSIKWIDFTKPKKREQIRGRVCQFRGTLRRLKKTPGVTFPDLGIDTIYEGQIQGAKGHWYSFYCLSKPQPEIERSDVAILTGVYYKLIRYSTRGGDEKIVPLFITNTITSERGYDTPSAGSSRVSGYIPTWSIYLLFAVIAVALCVFFHYRFKQQPRQRYKRSNEDSSSVEK